MPTPVFTAFDSNGDPVSNGKLCVYNAGSTTPATTYTSASLATANANPVRTNAAGQASVFLVAGTSYKFILKTAGSDSTCSTGSTLWTADNIVGVPTTSGNTDVLGTAGEALSAGQVVYLSDGTAGQTAGSWYKADADLSYASTLPTIGVVPSAISSGTAGSIRLAGQVTGLSSLTVGGVYYVSGTAGSITTTAPTNQRRVGTADSTSTLLIGAPLARAVEDPALDEFRLTLTTAVPVTTADVTAATTLYLSPYKGNRIALYDAAGVAASYTSGELSIAVPATTSQMYDVFAYANSGTPTLELLAWTNDTTRATALVANVAVGVYTKSGDATRRYLGSFRTTTVSGQTEDSVTKRLVWNYYNRVHRQLRRVESTTWSYTTATVRQANGSAANKVEVVVGLAGSFLDLSLLISAQNPTGSISMIAGIGEDSTSTFTESGWAQSAATSVENISARYARVVAVGYHYYSWNEYSIATGTTTWYAHPGPPFGDGGLFGWCEA